MNRRSGVAAVDDCVVTLTTTAVVVAQAEHDHHEHETTFSDKPALVLTILCTAVFMASLDMFVVNVALNSIGLDYRQTSLSNLSWILNGYTIIYGALLVPAGRIADRFGRKAGFLVGLTLFTLASLACAASPGLWLLVAFRCLQAAGAAILTPASLGLVLTTLPEKTRTRSIRIWASSGALAGVAGPVVGGLLVQASWRWIFLLNLPIGIAAVVAAVKWIPNVEPRTDSPWPDLAGGMLLIVSIGAAALGLVEAPGWGWTSAATTVCWLASVVALLAFLYQSSRHPAPIIEFSMLKQRVFAWSNLTVLLLAIAFAIELLSVVLFLQESWHWSALRTGLAVAPGPCMVPIFAMIGQRLSHRLPVGTIAALGGLILALGPLLILAFVSASPIYLTILPGWLLVGVGSGLAFPTAIASATADLPAHQTSTGSAIVNMGRQLGTVLGTSLLVVILGAGAANASNTRAFVHAWWLAVALSLLGGAMALGITTRPRSAAAWIAEL